LKLLVSTCEYIKPSEAVRDQLILNLRDNSAREKLLDKS